MIESFDIVFFTLAFAVPGFLIDSFLRKFIPKETRADSYNFLYFLSLSCLNYAVWSWLIYIIGKSDYFTTRPILTGFAWFAILFVGPMIIATIILCLYKFKFFGKATAFFRLNATHPIPTSWDYKFSRINEKKWVVIVLEDDSEIAGLWWANSFASSLADERDVYLEEVYSVSEDGTWSKVQRTDGMYIKGDKIKLIQFWHDEIKEESV